MLQSGQMTAQSTVQYGTSVQKEPTRKMRTHLSLNFEARLAHDLVAQKSTPSNGRLLRVPSFQIVQYCRSRTTNDMTSGSAVMSKAVRPVRESAADPHAAVTFPFSKELRLERFGYSALGSK